MSLLIASLLFAASAQAGGGEFPVPLPGTHSIGPIDQDRFDACHAVAAQDADSGVVQANQWLQEGGGILAQQCLGFAQAQAGDFAAAAAAFSQAAIDAAAAGNWRAANLWAQAGNAALLDGDAATARRCLDAALALNTLSGESLGQTHLDRARAMLATGEWAAARSDLELATQFSPRDPLAWLLTATLARRQDDLGRAQSAIQVAASLGPTDAAIALEAGNIAAAGDRLEAARLSWESAVALGRGNAIAATARARLAELAQINQSANPTAPVVADPQAPADQPQSR